MFDLTRDFVQNGGTFMVLGREGGLDSGCLIRTQVEMIRAVQVPNLLPLYIKEMNDRVSLEYNISGKRMLSQALKSERLSMTEYYGLLLQTALMLHDSSKYMLRPEQYILNEDYIFIEGGFHLGRLHFTYIPLSGFPSVKNSLNMDLKELMMRLMASVTELKGSGVQALLKYCGDEGFSLSGYKQLLIELLANEGGTAPEERGKLRSDPGRTVSANEHRKDYTLSAHEGYPALYKNSAQSWTAQARNRPAMVSEPQMAGSPVFSKDFYENHISISVEEQEQEAENPAARTYWLLGGMLVSALIWRFLYMSSPGTVTLASSAAATAAAGWAAYLGSKGKFRRAEASFPEPDSGELELDGGKNRKASRFQVDKLTGWLPSRKSPRNYAGEESGHTNSVYEDNESSGAFSAAAEETDDYYGTLSARTEFLGGSGSDAGTTLLRSSAEGVDSPLFASRGSSAYLEVKQSGSSAAERVNLDQAHFIIGRSSDVAQFVSQAVGASRAHVEVSRGKAGYILKDLASKNGTLLRGEPMVPYREYSLSEGDEFVIAGDVYTFHCS